MRIHFYLESYQMPKADFESWDPDLTPNLYLHGIGHNVLELAKRLQLKGHLISLGPKVMKRADLVVFYKRHLVFDLRSSIFLTFIMCQFPVLYIRGDLPENARYLKGPDRIVVPNKTAICRINEVFIPPLVQRGLLKSGRNDDSPIEKLAIKCNNVNLPERLDELQEMILREFPNMNLRVDTNSKTFDSFNNWHDFRDLDVSLLFRRSEDRENAAPHKPPSQLINAWCAGTIPIVHPIKPYVELISDGEDGFVVNSNDEVLQVIRLLNSNVELRTQVRRSILKRQIEYSGEKILNEWEQLIIHTKEEVNVNLLRSSRIFLNFLCQWTITLLKGNKNGRKKSLDT